MPQDQFTIFATIKYVYFYIFVVCFL